MCGQTCHPLPGSQPAVSSEPADLAGVLGQEASGGLAACGDELSEGRRESTDQHRIGFHRSSFRYIGHSSNSGIGLLWSVMGTGQ